MNRNKEEEEVFRAFTDIYRLTRLSKGEPELDRLGFYIRSKKCGTGKMETSKFLGAHIFVCGCNTFCPLVNILDPDTSDFLNFEIVPIQVKPKFRLVEKVDGKIRFLSLEEY